VALESDEGTEHRCNYTDEENPKYSEKNFSHCHFVPYKYDMHWPGIDPVICNDRPTIDC
jgi:hypothetical protein